MNCIEDRHGLFYHNFCCRPRCRENRCCIPGPQGPMGPRGYTGSAGTGDAIYASTATATVASAATIPLTRTGATSATSMSVSSNAVIMPIGTYLINYTVNGCVASAGTLSAQLTLNGTAIANEKISVTAPAYTSVGGSRSAVITISTASSALTLVNVSGVSVAFNYALITVLKL